MYVCMIKTYFSYSIQGVLDTTLCDKVCQWPVTDQWFSLGTLVSSTNKTYNHHITEILALNTITLTPILSMFNQFVKFSWYFWSPQWLDFCMRISTKFLSTIIK
jgi:hypothetical protein